MVSCNACHNLEGEVKSVKSHWFIDHFFLDIINIIKFIMQIGSQTNGCVHPTISFLRIIY